ncbi:MAG: transglutaminase domain-containing protein [Candidatus ainarchaeum sp.]|nr:transglutaminase domain-containing protein [Candidatus ainarchaeum sp.]
MRPFLFYSALLLAILSIPSNHAVSTNWTKENPGYATFNVSKFWIVQADDSVREINLTGFFIANNSFQRITSMESNADLEQDGELIIVHYNSANPNQTTVIYANAIVEVHYPQSFPPDPQLPSCQHTQNAISTLTASLSSSTVLPTLASIDEWVYGNMAYDQSYMGKSETPEQILASRRGVCTQYAALAGAMLDSLCIPHRMVSGYAIQNGTFQPHAWLEAQAGNVSIPMDPTFGELGALYANHIISSYWFNSSEETADSLIFACIPSSVSAGCDPGAVSMDTNFSIDMLSYRDFSPMAGIEQSYDQDSGALSINLTNPSAQNLLLTYNFASAPDTYGQDMHIIALAPGRSRTFTYALDKSGFEKNYVYTIPYHVEMQGTRYNQTVTFSLNGNSASNNPVCQPVLLLAFSAAFFFRKSSRLS